MSQPPSDETDDLQFDVAELDVPPGSPAGAAPLRTCVGCRRPIGGTYYAVGDKLVCPHCRAQIDAPPPGRRVGRVSKATVFGLGAGLVGAAIWFAVRRVAHLEIGLIAVLVGFMVGKAVRAGSGNRGGRGYQVLAVALTYLCISLNYVPDVLEAVVAFAHKHDADGAGPTARTAKVPQPTTTFASVEPGSTTRRATTAPTVAATPPAPHQRPSLGKLVVAVLLAIVLVVGLALAAPFLGGAANLIGLLIIGFALWEAWKLNARRRVTFTGPYQVGAPRTPPLPGMPR